MAKSPTGFKRAKRDPAGTCEEEVLELEEELLLATVEEVLEIEDEELVLEEEDGLMEGD
jgi:hypothetical protein